MHTLSVRALFCAGLAAVACASILPLFSPNLIEAAGMSALDPYGSCAAPSHQGFNICNPPEGSPPNTWSTGSPVQVIAAATSGTGQVETMEVWADGKKVAESQGSPFDQPISLDLGTHTLQVAEIDSTGAELKSVAFQVDVMDGNGSGDCAAPGSPGVNICTPVQDGCNTQPWVNIVATGKGKSGKVDRMELWIDGEKIANFPGDHINTNLIMVFGTVKIDEVDSKGNTISKSVFYTGPC
jgi:hypothetical protein